jgi:hypothetical protein
MILTPDNGVGRRRPAATTGLSERPPRRRHPVLKPDDGSALPQWKEDLNQVHRTVRAQVEHALVRMKTWKILRDYRRAAATLAVTASGIAHLHNIALAA